MKKQVLFFVLVISLLATSCIKEVMQKVKGPATDVVTERLVDSLTVIHLQSYYYNSSFISLGSYSVTNKTDSSITVHGLILHVTDNRNTVTAIGYKNGMSSNFMQMDPVSYFVPIEESVGPGETTRKVNILSINNVPFNYMPDFGNMLVSIQVKNVISTASTEAPKTNSKISFNVVP